MSLYIDAVSSYRDNRDHAEMEKLREATIEVLRRRIEAQDKDIEYLNNEILKWQQIAESLREEFWR